MKGLLIQAVSDPVGWAENAVILEEKIKGVARERERVEEERIVKDEQRRMKAADKAKKTPEKDRKKNGWLGFGGSPSGGRKM